MDSSVTKQLVSPSFIVDDMSNGHHRGTKRTFSSKHQEPFSSKHPRIVAAFWPVQLFGRVHIYSNVAIDNQAWSRLVGNAHTRLTTNLLGLSHQLLRLHCSWPRGSHIYLQHHHTTYLRRGAHTSASSAKPRQASGLAHARQRRKRKPIANIIKLETLDVSSYYCNYKTFWFEF